MPQLHTPKPVSAWTDPRHRRGYAGERAAIAFLLRGGWRIEAHRFRFRHHDLDLIARRGTLVAFIEVKTRTTRQFGRAVEAVGYRKRAVIGQLAEVWRLRHGRTGDSYRYDVITVEPGPGESTPAQVTHIEGAWRGVER